MTETPTLAVVESIRNGPSLADIAGQLRRMADRIEGAVVDEGVDYGAVEAAQMVLVFRHGTPIEHFVWGRLGTRHEIAGRYLHCATRVLE